VLPAHAQRERQVVPGQRIGRVLLDGGAKRADGLVVAANLEQQLAQPGARGRVLRVVGDRLLELCDRVVDAAAIAQRLRLASPARSSGRQRAWRARRPRSPPTVRR